MSRVEIAKQRIAEINAHLDALKRMYIDPASVRMTLVVRFEGLPDECAAVFSDDEAWQAIRIIEAFAHDTIERDPNLSDPAVSAVEGGGA